MDMSSLAALRADREERLKAFRYDAFQGSQLRIELAGVAEARREGTSAALRRADLFSLQCEFNLREGIASDFQIVGVDEPLLAGRPPRFADFAEDVDVE